MWHFHNTNNVNAVTFNVGNIRAEVLEKATDYHVPLKPAHRWFKREVDEL